MKNALKKVSVTKDISFCNSSRFTLIAGPCQMESKEHALKMAKAIKAITDKLDIDYVYKSSFDKANRTSLNSERGIGLEASLPIFSEIKETVGCPVLTDIHTEAQCEAVKDVIDIIQIPAFLCRQTDLLIAAANTGCVVNVKKGQFLAPWDMENVVKKVTDSGNNNVVITDRGTSFGYNTLVSDMRGLRIMANLGFPVVIDATHSIQQPGGLGGASGGQREFVPVIARAAIAVGVAGVFMEVHDNPDNAPSDGPCMVKLDELEELLTTLVAIDDVIKR